MDRDQRSLCAFVRPARQGAGRADAARSALVANGRLVVRDPGNARFTVYPLAGGEPDHWRYESNSFGYLPLTLHPDGGISTPVSVLRGTEWRSVVLRYDARGVLRDTIEAPHVPYEPRRLVVESNGGRASYSIPYTPAPVWTYLPDGSFAGGLPVRPALIVVRPAGTVRLERTDAPVRISRQEREAVQDGLVAQIRRTNNAQFRWQGPGIPEVKPYFSAIGVDGDGRLWVRIPAESRRVAPSREGGAAVYREPPRFDVYAPDLRYLGRVQLPEGFRFGSARGNRIWGIESDDLGVQYVVRYRIDRSDLR